MNNLSNITPYPDVNTLLQDMAQALVTTLADNLLGLYLFGSLTYGDFDPKSSDIDLVAVVLQPASAAQLESLKRLHVEIGERHPTWVQRLECSYTPRDMLHHLLPPQQPRPYMGEGIFYPEAGYGNEWIINLYLLQKHGITLIGPDFSYLVNPIPIIEVQKAAIRDLFREWEPKISDPAWLDNSHYQSYIILNLCRILFTVLAEGAGSKKISAAWVKTTFPRWQNLIQTAQNWHYGVVMTRRAETITFIQFAIDQVKQSPLYGQASP